MLTGSCFCGSMTYELRCAIRNLVFCHCSRCRKESSSAYNSVSIINAKDFTFTSSVDTLAHYVSNDRKLHFCKCCGTHLFAIRNQEPDNYRLRIGTLNEDFVPEKKIHIFTGSKASWDEICDEHPQFEEMIEPSKL